MAYIDFAQPLPAAGDGISLPAIRDRIKAVATGLSATNLSPMEWQIVRLARTDGRASLREPGRWSRIRALIFGPQPHFRLANGKLEALRRLAVEAWHEGFAVRPSAIADFQKAGFSEGQLETLLTAVNAERHNFKGIYA
ncbi:hypothetical protein [Sphingobium sp. CAP-1]|uniref:hypothetical protein n=1 Tax=Sphingobium sp. CAP-1 TaxID=2676077 RepID=UPI0012BB4751|nr:hypothetical protein [Sphingobium sp. CAP-1]QGP81029.1 hypothetical protein GL174_18410 [Sphingobium sp. CAP-1]